jgi:hypothetical protein
MPLATDQKVIRGAAETVVAVRSGVGAMTVRGSGRGRQIGSECLIMPDTCLGQTTARRLACSGRGSSVP